VSSDRPLRIGALTISDGVVAGTRTDTSGPAIRDWASGRGYHVVAQRTAPDETETIFAEIVSLVDGERVDVVLTTGGTGLTARDVTPEATRAALEREVPGIAERIRAAGAASTPYAALSRGLAGTRGSTLIVNLPGSTGGVRDGLTVLGDIIDHAVQLLRGTDTGRHDPPNG
jgi:molybdopterin adenylyltransferase